jgi:hypothetical protein
MYKLAWFLGVVFTAFCVILIVCYQISENAHPIFLDQNGHPTNLQSK